MNLGTGPFGIGVWGSHAGGGWGVYGEANASGGFGVYGNNSSGIGVYGTSTSNVGTKGKSSTYNGVWAESTSQDGLFASGGRDGAFMTGARFGAFGVTSSASAAVDYAGVVGSDGTGVTYSGGGALNGVAGVLGYGRSGVAGVTSAAGSWGVIGMKLTNPTTLGPFGVLGYSTYGVYSFGNMGASGTKPFVEPHPTDPTKVIRYVALEGPEAGTYFRGKAVVRDGVATIEVPESFRIVTDPEGLTVHVTAVGRASQTWVESADLNRIVIGATPDVAINYIVHGVRKAYKDSATATMPAVFSNEAKRRLIANGTYNPDGTVNMSTAENLGWARVWREQERVKAETPK